MKREFTTREKTLLLILSVMIIVIGYFKLILEPINDQVTEYQSQMSAEQTEIDQSLVLLAQMRVMEDALEEMKASGDYKTIPSHDNLNPLLEELNTIFEPVRGDSLKLNFGQAVLDDYIYLRPISVEFIAENYRTAREIIDQLHDSENLNQISDLFINVRTEDGQDQNNSQVTVSLTITYFELLEQS